MTTICSPNFQPLKKKVIISINLYAGVDFSFLCLAQEGYFPLGHAEFIGEWGAAAKTNILSRQVVFQSFGARQVVAFREDVSTIFRRRVFKFICCFIQIAIHFMDGILGYECF